MIGLLACGVCQAQRDGFVVKGELRGAPEKEWVFLTDVNQNVFYDSVQLQQGRFEFRGRMETPGLRSITIFKDPGERNYGWKNILVIPVYMENSEIRITAPYSEIPSKADKGTPESLRVAGSAVHDLSAAYKKRVEPFELKYNELFDQYRKAYYYREGTEEDVFRCVRDMDAMRDSIYYCGVDFIRKHGDSPVALYIAGGLNVSRYGKTEAQRAAGLFSAQFRGEEQVKALLKKPLYINDLMPDVQVLNDDLQTVKLSEYVKKGRYTLVEFWASWCGPCRSDIPHLKETYERYHAKGFDVVSVSIDDDHAKWKKAVEEEKMSWLQACAVGGKGFDKECMRAFGVRGVPSGFLVDPEGKIVHLSARGGWLNLKLSELFEN